MLIHTLHTDSPTVFKIQTQLCRLRAHHLIFRGAWKLRSGKTFFFFSAVKGAFFFPFFFLLLAEMFFFFFFFYSLHRWFFFFSLTGEWRFFLQKLPFPHWISGSDWFFFLLLRLVIFFFFFSLKSGWNFVFLFKKLSCPPPDIKCCAPYCSVHTSKADITMSNIYVWSRDVTELKMSCISLNAAADRFSFLFWISVVILQKFKRRLTLDSECFV